MKKQILFILFVLSFSLVPLKAQPPQFGCDKKTKTKIVLIGDSWAHFSWIYKAYRESLRKFGHADKQEQGFLTVVIGAQAKTWNHPIGKFLIQERLKLEDDAEAVVISLGGNDIIWGFDVGDPWEWFDADMEEAFTRMDTLIMNIREIRPDIRIIASGYDYPNFVDPIIDFPWNPYKDTWAGFGYPTPSEIAEALTRIEVKRQRWCDSIGIDYLNNLGLMQYTYGQKEPLPVWPFDPYPPKSVPFPGGDPRYPTPQEAMGLWGIDAYHLGPEGYTEVANNNMRQYLHAMFRGYPDKTMSSDGSRDGWVTEGGATGSGDIKVGVSKEGKPTKGLLSFNTADIPDNAVLTHASMFFTRKSVAGGNPIQQDEFPYNTHIDIKSGSFGTPELEAGDYSATADMEDAGCFVGHAWKNNYAIRVDFKPEALPFINKGGLTQMRLHFDKLNPNKNQLGIYYNGNEQEPYYAPYLDVFYTVDGEEEVERIAIGDQPMIKVFPNPAGEYVFLEGLTPQQAASMKVYNTMGSAVAFSGAMEGAGKYKLSVSQWPAGNYFIQLPGHSGKVSFNKL